MEKRIFDILLDRRIYVLKDARYLEVIAEPGRKISIRITKYRVT